MSDKKIKLGIIDLGTASTKLLIVEAYPDGRVDELLKTKEESRFGEYMDRYDNHILPERVQKNIDILKNFQDILTEHGVEKAHIFSTEVLRKAANTEEVVETIQNAVDIPLMVLEQHQEAEIFWNGITSDFTYEGQIAGMDIGGGSVEFVYGTKGHLEGYKPLPFGAMSLREKFLTTNPPTEVDYKKLEAFVRESIFDLDVQFDPDTPFIHGTSAVLDYYQAAKFPMKPYSYSERHPFQVDLEDTERIYHKMRIEPDEERRRHFPAQPYFMDACCVGTAIFLMLAEKTGLRYELPSNNNITNGLAQFMLQE